MHSGLLLEQGGYAATSGRTGQTVSQEVATATQGHGQDLTTRIKCDPDDEDVAELLERIKHRKRRAARGYIKMIIGVILRSSVKFFRNILENGKKKLGKIIK